MNFRTARRLLPIAVLGLGLVGCGRGTEESSAAGRNATVEYRPVVTAGGPMQKQRTGKLIKVTGDWVVIDEAGAEMWVPKDMVLEIRMGS